MKKQKIVILNITHGDNPYMIQPPFLPIAAGACRSDITNDACGEDNISAKNKWYGDFSSLYWAWKNLKGVDIIGTSHYRRYLADDDLLSNWQDEYYMSWESFSQRKYKLSNVMRELRKCDFVMLKPLEVEGSVKDQYLQWHPYPHNLECVTESLQKIHPESVQIWQQMLEEHIIQRGFLFLTRWKQFDELCSWLYPVLLEIESMIDVNQYDGYQVRVIAFLYERLVPVFIRTKGYKIGYRALYCIDNESNKSISDLREQCYKEKKSQYTRRIKNLIKKIVRI